MSAEWLPEELHPIAMRIARADAAAEELSKIALSWSRGDNDQGALSLRQVERTPGTYDVEVASIRPVPPIAAMLFSEAVHHLRSAVDNAVFHMAEKEHGQPFTPEQVRAISMLVHDDSTKFDAAIKRLTTGRNAVSVFEPTSTLGRRIAALQPFTDTTSIASLSPLLAMVMDIDAATAQPLALLRDYSNEDKHRTLRAAAGHTLVQRTDDWRRSVSQGMRLIEVGTVLEQVPKGVPTEVEISPALLLQRPDGTWIAPGPELDGMAQHVANVVVPTLVLGTALPDAMPAHVDLGDNGETIAERLSKGGKARAHERVRGIMTAALVEAYAQGWKFLPASVGDEED